MGQSRTLSGQTTRSRRHVVARAVGIAPKPVPTRLRKLEDLPVKKGHWLMGISKEILNHQFSGFEFFEGTGDDALMVNMGPISGYRVMLSNPEHIKEALADRSDVLVQNFPPSFAKITLPDAGTQGLPLAFRRAMHKVMTPTTVMTLQLPLLIKEYSRMIKQCVEGGKEEVMWYREAQKASFKAGCQAAVGDLVADEDLETMHPWFVATSAAQVAIDFGLEEGLPFTRYWRGRQAKKAFQKFLQGRISPHIPDIRAGTSSRGSIIVQLFAALKEEGIDAMAYTDEELASLLTNQVWVSMMAATDPTAIALGRVATFLAAHPLWLDRLWDEQQAIISSHGSAITKEVLAASVQATAFSQEVFRLRTPALLSFRKALEDTTVGDIEIPAGTKLALSLISAVRSTGTGLPEFDPDQWLSEDKTKVHANRDPANLAHGAGPRRCPGSTLAMAQVTTAVVLLARNVQKIEVDQEEIDRDFMLGLEHPTGLPAKMTPRAPAM